MSPRGGNLRFSWVYRFFQALASLASGLGFNVLCFCSMLQGSQLHGLQSSNLGGFYGVLAFGSCVVTKRY